MRRGQIQLLYPLVYVAIFFIKFWYLRTLTFAETFWKQKLKRDIFFHIKSRKMRRASKFTPKVRLSFVAYEYSLEKIKWCNNDWHCY